MAWVSFWKSMLAHVKRKTQSLNQKDRLAVVIMKRGELTYYIREEVVTVEYRRAGSSTSQFIAITVYGIMNRRPFKNFIAALVQSSDRQYGCLDALFGLTNRYGMICVPGTDPRQRLKLC
jgi:hypothetical protein